MDITKDYAGLFFRAEGGGSDNFGTTQSANQSWISNINVQTCQLASDSYNCEWLRADIKKNSWTDNLIRHIVNWDFEIFTTDGEVRPRNTAIRIWKRIKYND